MKKILFGLFTFLLAVGTIQAQEPSKALKKANRFLGKYNLDPSGNSDALQQAKDMIDIAAGGSETAALAKTWITKGKIYTELASADASGSELAKIKGEAFTPQYGDAAMGAFDALLKGKDLAKKKYEKNDVTSALMDLVPFLSNLGISKYGLQDFKGAYNAFNAVLSTKSILDAAGINKILTGKEEMQNQQYMTGLSAFNAEMPGEAETIFMQLYKDEYDNASIFDALYKLKSKDDQDGAMKILEEGRAKYPNDLALLYNEINYYLSANKLDELVSKLTVAIEKDPENKTLYSTLGNVYDNLFQREQEAGNDAKAQEHFDNAYSYYGKALEKDDKYFDAIYSIGALYYNKAAAISTEMKALEDDFSKDGMRKYETKKAEVYSFFDKSLPYFQKAEVLNPNDKNTLLALKEIFARKDDLATSEEFKKRIATIDGGGQVSGSYFAK